MCEICSKKKKKETTQLWHVRARGVGRCEVATSVSATTAAAPATAAGVARAGTSAGSDSSMWTMRLAQIELVARLERRRHGAGSHGHNAPSIGCGGSIVNVLVKVVIVRYAGGTRRRQECRVAVVAAVVVVVVVVVVVTLSSSPLPLSFASESQL